MQDRRRHVVKRYVSDSSKNGASVKILKAVLFPEGQQITKNENVLLS